MSEHYYTVDGKAAHSQPTKSKSAKNPTRPTTVVDAKKLGLLPSVSSILRVVNNPALERWKHTKIVEACFNANNAGPESLDEYTAFILEKAFDEVDVAADLGTRIHKGIEQSLKGEIVEDLEVVDYTDSALNKLDELGIKVEESEFVTVCPKYGYAGTTDIAFSKGAVCGILDFKSKRTKEGEPVVPSFGHAAQIAAYHVAYWTKGEPILDNTLGINVYISTTELGRVEVVQYDAEQLRKEFEMFLNCAAIWRYKSNYDPRCSGEPRLGE